MKTKPLYTLPGNKTLDVEALAKFYEKLTGKKPTPEELKRAQEGRGQSKG